MATLISPGTSVTVTDESFSTSAGPGTVPLIVIATGQDKLTSAGDSIAEGTTKANAGKLYLASSQRELLQTYGVPNFNSVGGNAQHGNPLNEYGLLTAHSYLGIANRAYVLRADLDLNQLQPLDDAPTAAPADGTYWMNPANVAAGLYVHNGTAWVKTVPFISTDYTISGPEESTTADYAITVGRVLQAQTVPTADVVYENKLWKRNGLSWVEVRTGFGFDLQYKTVYPTLKGTASTITIGPLVAGVRYTIDDFNTGDDFTNVGAASNATGVTFVATGTTPTVYTNASTLSYYDALVAGDIWIKLTESTYPVSLYDATTGLFADVEVPLYASGTAATAGYGTSLAEGSLYAQYGYNSDILDADVVAQNAVFRHNGLSVVDVTSTHAFPTAMTATIVIIDSVNPAPGLTITITSQTTAAAAAAVANAVLVLNNSPVVALDVNGSLVFREQNGDDFQIRVTSGSVGPNIDNGIYSNWELLTYADTIAEPTGSLEDGVLWYSAEFNIDILVNDGIGNWDDLTGTLYVQPAEPTTPVNGDVWVDTDQLDSYPVIYRRTAGAWVLVDNTDQTSPTGIVFADARSLNSGAVAADAPDALAYPAGVLLWNTRYSTRNVKEWKVAYTVDGNLIGDVWVSRSGNATDGSLITGQSAVRKVVVQALAAAVVASEDIRAETVFFNLIAAPGYPELMDEMVSLNVDKKQIASVISECPMTLRASSTDIQNWATNTAGASSTGVEGLVTADTYLAVYYPGAGLATNLDGTEVVVPASHMMLRTIAYNDQVAYQWFAPAGLNRGVISNAASVGYIDSEGEFVSVSLNEGMRDVLYSNNINPIRNIPNRGLVAWGQKTRSPVASAMDRLNVARLVNYVRYQADLIAQPFLFEPNDVNTRSNIKTAYESFMSGLITLRGITDFIVVCDGSNNTSDRIDRNELWVEILLVPTKAVEFIYIPIRIRNTGSI